jgi:hypothetical protein
MHTSFDVGIGNGTVLPESHDPNVSGLDLFAEELVEQRDHLGIPGVCCVATASCIGACFACLSSVSSGC